MQRRFRLRNRQNFARLRREGRVYHHRLLRLSLLPNGLPHNRYGVIVPRHLGKAVVRNRTRRLVRETLRQLDPHLQTGFDLVIIARSGVVGQPLDGIRRILESLCNQAEIWVS